MSQHHRRLNRGRWQHARRAALERDGYRCVECVDQGLGGAGKLEVHHITPLSGIRDGDGHWHKGGLPFALDNLKTLCRDCHIETSVFGPRLEWRRHIANNFKELHQ